jgi:secondary thiamine-phosphate synthase enzyme
MLQAVGLLHVRTERRGLVEVTDDVQAFVRAQEINNGLLTVFCRHTSASLLIQENVSAEVRTDLEQFFEDLAPESAERYHHADEGPDDMPAHIRTALTNVQLSIPLIEGRLALGTWQGIFVFEHRRRPHLREIALHILGERAATP